MPKGKITDMYTKAKRFSIYVFLDMSTREFIVTKSANNDPKKWYSRNMSGDVNKTHNMIEAMKEIGRRPCMIKLADIEETPVVAYKHEIAWTKWLVDNGYVSIAQGETPYCLDDMLDDTLSIYESIKKVNISKLLSCDNCICVTYRQKHCNKIDGTDIVEDEDCLDESILKNKKDSKMIKLSLSLEEKEAITKNAKASGKNVSEFIRDLCLHPKVVVYKYTEFAKANSRIDSLLKEIDSMCQKISCLKSYSYSDLDFLESRFSEISTTEQELAQSFQREIEMRTQELIQSLREKCQSNIVTKVTQSSNTLKTTEKESHRAHIRIKMTNDDYETLLKYKDNMERKIPNFVRTTNAYIKELAKNFCIVFEDYSELDRNDTLFRCLNHYVRTVVSIFGNKDVYRPAEIDMICEYYEGTRHSKSEITTMHYIDIKSKDKAITKEIKAQLGKVVK